MNTTQRKVDLGIIGAAICFNNIQSSFEILMSCIRGYARTVLKPNEHHFSGLDPPERVQILNVIQSHVKKRNKNAYDTGMVDVINFFPLNHSPPGGLQPFLNVDV